MPINAKMVINQMKRMLSNIHTHSTWCDGNNTLDEMAEAALELGFTDLGFSSHAPAPFDEICPGIRDEAAYRADIARVKDEYAGRLGILCGIEADIYTPADDNANYDYVIGANHFLPIHDGSYIAVDSTPENLRTAIDDWYAGAAMAMLRDFYALTLKGVNTLRPDVAAHFDLPKKYNRDGAFFDEESPEYRRISLESLDAVLDVLQGYGGLLEVNTGAWARGLRDDPYPALFLLQHAAQRSARVIITSDSHATSTLNGCFAEARQMLHQAGFASMVVLEGGAFREVKV